MKTHWLNGCAASRRAKSFRVEDTNTFRVDCGLCVNTATFKDAHALALVSKHEAFMAQEPRTFMEPWHTTPKPMVCGECGGDQFRMGDRTCYGHYQDYVCATCGHANSRLTETGMSF